MSYLRSIIVFIFLGLAQGASAQDFQRGFDAYSAGDFATALQEWRPLAEQGLAEAQLSLGVLYKDGLGVPQDYQEAAKWYSKAAEQGVAHAQINLGYMYFQGLGIPQDLQETAKLFRMAAEQGLAEAQIGLGLLYKEGFGVQQSNIYAHMWYNLAASLGNEGAKKKRNELTKTMSTEDLNEAQKLARECFAKDFKGC